jgi:hypothetical protein
MQKIQTSPAKTKPMARIRGQRKDKPPLPLRLNAIIRPIIT